MPGPLASARAPAIRWARSAVSWAALSGFCGETSQITRSSFSRRLAVSATWAWPSWAGLNEPPNSPTRIPGSRCRPSRSAPGRPASGTRLAGPANHILVRRQLLRADRSPGVQPVRGDADFGAESELPAVGELGRGVDQHDGAIHEIHEGLGRAGILGD